jgi:hypothetical protein
MNEIAIHSSVFPFGRILTKVFQKNFSPKPVFVLGLNGSAIFARFISKDRSIIIHNIPVDNEPFLFWNGGLNDARNIVSEIKVSKNIGRLATEAKSINGITGRIFDKYYLQPLKLNRELVWICNFVPHYIATKSEVKSIKKYNKISGTYSLPKAELPTKKVWQKFITETRTKEVLEELFRSKAEIIVTLGQQPIKLLLQQYDINIQKFFTVENYGFVSETEIESVKYKIIALYHPRQLLKEKNVDSKIGLLHYDWIKTRAKIIKLF